MVCLSLLSSAPREMGMQEREGKASVIFQGMLAFDENCTAYSGRDTGGNQIWLSQNHYDRVDSGAGVVCWNPPLQPSHLK